jgi:hypothetical protein
MPFLPGLWTRVEKSDPLYNNRMDNSRLWAGRRSAAIFCVASLLSAHAAFAAVGRVGSVEVDAPQNAGVGGNSLTQRQTLSSGLAAPQISLSNGSLATLTPVPSVVPAAGLGGTPQAMAPVIAPAAEAEPFLDSEAPFHPMALPPSAAARPESQWPDIAPLKLVEDLAAGPGRLQAPAARVRAGMIATIKSFFSSRGEDAGAAPVAGALTENTVESALLGRPSVVRREAVASGQEASPLRLVTDMPATPRRVGKPAARGWSGFVANLRSLLGL